MLVSVKQLKKETNYQPQAADREAWEGAFAIPEEKAAGSKEQALIDSLTAGNVVDKNINLENRKAALSRKRFEPTDFAYERSIGQNDSLYSNFAELIALTKRKVGRIVLFENGEKEGYATGFMVSNRLLLTNWHVFRTKEQAEESEVHFFYEYDAQGRPTQPVIFKFDTTGFFNNKDLDYCFVAVQPLDVTGKVTLESIGYLYLDLTPGKIGEEGVEKLNIIHHPQGDYKQISIRENTFNGANRTKISYLTDTAPGSSGSPVLNDQWQVVGLHHKSIAKMDKDGNYLDQDGQVIPTAEDKIDVTRIVWEENEGIRISVILKHLFEKHPNDDLIATLTVQPPPENLSFSVNTGGAPIPEQERTTVIAAETHKSININVPVDALSGDRSIDISLSSKTINAENEPRAVTPSDEKVDELHLEVAKVDKEQAVDFSGCAGYDPTFLGVGAPLPQPQKSIKKQIARLKNKEIELKYFKHSVIFNAVTKMPLISAVNVEGDPAKRPDNSKRNDDWLRDKRIDIECQLRDQFYKGSNFDKGHMSRFEDANWGDTVEEALLNGIYTCFYTNACPQAVKFNRGGGLWGKLEKAALEQGAKKEKGKQRRMTVFNGPVFNGKKDRVFKGVTIPMEYYKVILWLGDDNQLKATAFKLSQETSVSDINFDESMRIEAEALNIDQNVVFKHSQCSLKKLGKLTNIDFKPLEQYDTFKTTDGSEEISIEDEKSIVW